MATLVTATLLGRERVAGVFVAIQNAVKDLRPFWREVFAPKFFGESQDRFALQGQTRDAGGRFNSGRWARLSPAYARWKAVHYPGRTILVRDGALRESMRWAGRRPGAGGIFDPQPDYVIAGTSIAYAAAHMKGRPNMPARPFMSTPDPKVYGLLMRTWILRESGMTS